MKQLILATTALTVLSTAAFANGNAEHKSHHAKHHHKAVSEAATPVTSHGDDHFKSGFYLGANAGVSHNRNKLRNELNFNALSLNHNQLKGSKSKTSPIGELLVGGRFVMNQWLLGAEVSANMDGHRVSKNFTHNGAFPVPVSIKFKKEYGIVPALVIAHRCNERNALFLKLGAAINRYKISLTDNFTGNHIKFSGHKTKVGFAPTIGMEHSFSRHLSAVASIGAEFNGTVKKRFGKDGVFLTTNGDFDKVKNKTTAYTAKVGVMWKL